MEGMKDFQERDADDDFLDAGRCRFPFQQLERGSSASVSSPFSRMAGSLPF